LYRLSQCEADLDGAAQQQRVIPNQRSCVRANEEIYHDGC
jgi:hypothetical protein